MIILSLLALYIFHTFFSSVFIAEFEHLSACWVSILKTIPNTSMF